MTQFGFRPFASGASMAEPQSGVVSGRFGEVRARDLRLGERRTGARASRAGVEIEGLTELRRALRGIGEVEGPAAKAYEIGIEEAADIVKDEIPQEAPGSMAQRVDRGKSTGKADRRKARVVVNHPGANAMEFGRRYYWVGYTGRKKRSGRLVLHSPGQKAKPFVGIKDSDHALGRATGAAAEAMQAGIERAWNIMIGRGGAI